MARLKELGDENRRLKKIYAEERLKAEIIKEALGKKVAESLFCNNKFIVATQVSW